MLVSPIPPFLLQTDDNPDGLPQSIFDNFTEAAKADMPAWMTTFLNNFFSTGSKRDTGVSDQAFQANWNLAITASGTAAVDCIGTWLTDFREDLPRIDVPLMVIQGDADQVLPFETTGKRVGEFADDVDLVVIPGASHAIPWTHAQEVNDALLRFLSVNAEALAG